MLQLSEIGGGVQTNDCLCTLQPDLDNVLNRTYQRTSQSYYLCAYRRKCQRGFVTELQDVYGNTVLHYVAQGGSLNISKALVKKNSDVLQIVNKRGELPLINSIYNDSKELDWYLTLITRVESPSSLKILRTLIGSSYITSNNIVLYFIRRDPELALANDECQTSLLWWLVSEPSHVLSGSKLGFFKRWMYKYFLQSTEGIPTLFTSIQPRSFATQVLSIKVVIDAKFKYKYIVELVNLVCTQLSSISFQQISHFLHRPPIMDNAIEVGIEEVVKTILQHFPYLIKYTTKPQRNILQIAVEYRQQKIVNILKEISPTRTRNLYGQLEVEKTIYPFLRKQKNYDNQTTKDKWMKDTANSSIIISTLIATVLLAAAFTLPGGNVNDKGIPILLRTNTFMVFAISNALGLFSSMTSLVMFLAILTARYVIEDFFESLPKKLIIGLGSLFFAIAAMIIAFGATLTIILSDRWQWVAVPITLIASFPVAIFVMLQLPLFVQMIHSTYGSSIFRSLPSRC
ncbi:hypothetical protein ACOSP7_020142 [Xanthoceras sorbifolium]